MKGGTILKGSQVYQKQNENLRGKNNEKDI